MLNESKEKAIDLIIDTLHDSNIDAIDKLELMINIKQFLENYDKSIKILRKEL